MNQDELKEIIEFLQRTPKIITELARAIPDSLINSSEGKNTWSAYDVVGHLIHGEKTDWIPRTKHIFEFGEYHDRSGQELRLCRCCHRFTYLAYCQK